VKKVLMVLGVVFLVLVVGFIGLLIWAQRSGATHQAAFFQAVESGDPRQVTALFHPALKEEVDEPVLAAWMKAVQANLGAFKGLSKTNFNTSSKYENGAWITESKGKVEFEKGEADAELVFRDNQVVKFHVQSDKIPADWFRGPASTDLYRERGKEFLSRFLNSQADEAYGMMHEGLKKNVSLDKFKAMIAQITEKAGKLKSITYDSEKLEPGENITLRVFYKIDCEKAPMVGNAKFEFVGLKGHLLGFNVSEP